MPKDIATRRALDRKLNELLIGLEQVHRNISPDTHGENYHPVINDMEDVLEKVRAIIAA